MGRRELSLIQLFSAGRLSGLLAVLVMTLACGGLTSSPTTASPGQETAERDRRMVALTRQLTVNEVEIARLRQQVADLEKALAEARSALAAASTEQRERAAREPTEVASATWPSTVESSDIDLEELQPEEPATPPGTGAPSSTTPSASPQTTQPAAATVQALYDEAYTLFHERQYPEAEQRFLRFLDLYPTTDLADNALFWVGESRYARGDYNAALSAFSDTVERYPQGNKISDALLKAGKCLEALGDRERARETYAEVMQRFPASVAAITARELLEQP